VDEPPQLQTNGHWRMAVWALRVGYAGLAIAAVGFVLIFSGSTPWLLAVGVLIWLSAAAITLTGVLWSHHDLADPRPGLWPMRFMLIRDTSTPGRV
jgi:hypothetical protein